ncbi:SH3 domain-containing protein [Tenacibaculum agarivorans]|uniref:SH3 domain-containing protein n=1 Tax=Tenacibaculum agarivorans TaxID=1908389 RepID=UPI00094BBFC7|nr:SH3 domain-containing protein [Tenacibaculum agarivorans]
MCCKTDKEEILKQQDVTISYQLKEGKDHCGRQLLANVNGKEQILINYNEKLNLYIQLQDDFNNDGALDVLLENRKGCYDKGEYSYVSHEGSSYFIMTYDGKKFRRTKEVGKAWNGIEMEMKEEKLHFTIETHAASVYSNTTTLSCDDKEEVFVLDGYNFKRVSVNQVGKRKAITGVDCINLIENQSIVESRKYIDFDLDNDGHIDQLTLTYNKITKGFDKLDVLFHEYNPNRNIAIPKRSIKRLGVLASKTNEVNDLVIDCNEILAWDGEKYKYKPHITLNNRYKVFAKNGLLIRDQPASYGNVIGKFDYGTEITILEKTDIEMKYNDKEEEYPIEGYWYQTEFIDKESNTKRLGYVFSGFLINLDYYSIFSRWGELRISKQGIIIELHSQCYYTYPVKIISDTEVELIWSQDMDCKFKSGLSDNFDLQNVPEKGKPFAKYVWKGDTLKATYYYPEWIKKYNDNYPAIFRDTYNLNYASITDW